MAAITTREEYVEEGQSAMIASGRIVVYSKGLPDLKVMMSLVHHCCSLDFIFLQDTGGQKCLNSIVYCGVVSGMKSFWKVFKLYQDCNLMRRCS